MQPINYTDLSSNTYLIASHQNTYLGLNDHLKSIISWLLSSDDLIDFNNVHLTFDILNLCQNEGLQQNVAKFFSAFLCDRDDDKNSYLKKVLKICQEQCQEAFFKCASTRKIRYYSKRDLNKIIDDFHEILPKKEVIHEFIPFPYYDEGGEALLLQIQNHSVGPKKQDTIKAPSQFHIKPVGCLSEILANQCSFNTMKSIAIQYLTKLAPKNRLSMSLYTSVFRFSEDDKSGFKFHEDEKVVLIKLIVTVTSNENYPIHCFYSLSDLYEVLEEAQSVHQKCGEELVLTFCNGVILQKQVSLDEAIQGFKLLRLLSDDLDLEEKVSEMLRKLSSGDIRLTIFLNNLESLVSNVDLDVMTHEGDIDILLERFAGKDPSIHYSLCKEELEKMREQYTVVEGYCESWKKLRLSKLVNMALEIKEGTHFSTHEQENILKLIAIGRLALRIKFSIYLYNTQILTLLGHLSGSGKSISQVKTGEGKSMIVTLLAFVLSLQGKNIHVISSSPQLAIRDQVKCAEFFKAFEVTTSHICTQQPEASLFQAQILYGTVSDFKFAIMREMLYFKELFPINKTTENSRFDSAIIDEVDNLTIDTQLSSARLSFPSEISYEWVYAPILMFVKNNFKDAEIELPLNTIEKLKIFMNQYMNGKFKDSVSQLSEKQLTRWVQSARRALFKLSEFKQYVIKEIKDDTGRLERSILIMDAENTGRGLSGSRWGNGVHEFIEVKHEVKVQKESLTPISLSNSVFYTHYNSLYGFTGTLGSKLERQEIKELYGMNSFDVPSHKPQQRIDIPPIIVGTDADYFSFIIMTIEECLKKRRPVLVICKTIQDSQAIEAILNNCQVSFEMLNEMQTKSEDQILENAGLPGSVTIATNTAGRGTDIKLKGESYKNGGLHVLLTFFPESQRVEAQARGRAGRQGEPGSSAMILSASGLGIKNFKGHQYEQRSVIANLESRRKLNALTLKGLLVKRAETEKLIFHLTTQFFSSVKEFNCLLSKDGFLEEYSIKLSHRVFLAEKKLNNPGLNSSDLQIAKDALKLFSEGVGNTLRWVTLLKQTGSLIQKKMINDWALHFYQEVEDLAHEIKCEQQSAEIKDLFIKNKRLWEKYMDNSGSGIIQYLDEMTGLDLKYIYTDIQ